MPRSPRATITASARRGDLGRGRPAPSSSRSWPRCRLGRRRRLAHLHDVGGPPHERHGDELDAGRRHRLGQHEVLGRSGANICSRSHGRCTPGRPCVRPPLSTSATHAVGRRRRRPAARSAVADDHPVAGVEVLEQRRVVDGDRRRRCSARRPARGAPSRPAPRSTPPSGNVAGADLRARAGRRARRPGARPRSATSRTVAQPLEVLVDGAVAEVEPDDVDAGPRAAPRARRRRRWPDRAWRRSSCGGSCVHHGCLSSRSMELLLIRHALPVRRELVDGPADPELSPRRARPGRAPRRRTSPTSRSTPSTPARCAGRVQTAAPLAARHGLDGRDRRTGVAEWDRNAAEYVPIEELQGVERPTLAGDGRRRVDSADEDAGRVPRRASWRPSSAIIAAHPGETVAVVCHGGVINTYLGHVLGPAPARHVLLPRTTPSIHRVAASRSGERADHDVERDRAPARHAACRSGCSTVAERDPRDPTADAARLPRRARRRRGTPCGRRAHGCSSGRLQPPSTSGRRGPTSPTPGSSIRGGALIAWRRPAASGPRAVAHRRRPHRLAGPAGQAAPRHRRRSGGGSSASRSTAACCSTLARPRPRRSPAGSCSPTARDVLVDVAEPIARVPQLAIHLDRDVNERGLVLDRQAHLTPVWAHGACHDAVRPSGWPSGPGADDDAGVVGAVPVRLQPAAVLGADRSLLASGRLDNLVSCWAATTALVDADARRPRGR